MTAIIQTIPIISRWFIKQSNLADFCRKSDSSLFVRRWNTPRGGKRLVMRFARWSSPWWYTGCIVIVVDYLFVIFLLNMTRRPRGQWKTRSGGAKGRKIEKIVAHVILVCRNYGCCCCLTHFQHAVMLYVLDGWQWMIQLSQSWHWFCVAETWHRTATNAKKNPRASTIANPLPIVSLCRKCTGALVPSVFHSLIMANASLERDRKREQACRTDKLKISKMSYQ